MCNLWELQINWWKLQMIMVNIPEQFGGIAKDYGYRSHCDGCKGLWVISFCVKWDGPKSNLSVLGQIRWSCIKSVSLGLTQSVLIQIRCPESKQMVLSQISQFWIKSGCPKSNPVVLIQIRWSWVKSGGPVSNLSN